MSEHTPGPWEVIDGDSSGGWDAPSENEYVVITRDPKPRPNNQLASFWDTEFGHEAYANARLIAAALDLLEACELAIWTFNEANNEVLSNFSFILQ